MKTSAGLLAFRRASGGLEVFLVHPGGPFYRSKDDGVWSIPKGEFNEDEEPLAAAQREFMEETGFVVDGNFMELGTAKQKSGKLVHAWAVAADFDADAMVSNTFEMEWPPRSGRKAEFPEVDKGCWYGMAEARVKIIPGQAEFLERLEALLAR
ncbi:MAG: NUDIX domain-containing protein [Gemmatimonadaceae bacterium]